MTPLIVEEKANITRRKIIIILLTLIIIFSLAFDYVYIFYNQNSNRIRIENGGLSKEEILKRENLQEISRINSENPVSTTTKQNLLNDLNKLNSKTTSKIKK